MKMARVGLPIVFVLTFASLANYAKTADAPKQSISTRDLKTLEIPGKVAAVLWTARPERCTLQIVFPSAGRGNAPGLHRSRIQAWLLRADGSAIASIGRADAGTNAQNFSLRRGVEEVLIAFPRGANLEAVAVALRVDDAFLIERLPSVPIGST